MDGTTPPVRFYGRNKQRSSIYSATTPPNWGRNSHSHRRFPAVAGRPTPRPNGASFGPGDIIDTSGVNYMEESPMVSLSTVWIK